MAYDAGLTPKDLIEPRLMGRLEQLDIVARKILVSRQKGERRSKRRGNSVEFDDYRPYVRGDDIRHLDWNVYGRLEKLFIKLFREEEDIYVHILVDASASMDHGSPCKFDYARKLAAALAYTALMKNHRTSVGSFSGNLDAITRPLRGRHKLLRLLTSLCQMQPQGSTNLMEACKTFYLGQKAKGVVIVISDFFDRSGFEGALKYFLGQKLEVCLLQVMSEDEVDPPFAGDLKLRDAEDGDDTDMTISAPLLKAYRKNLGSFLEELRSYCVKRGLKYLFATTATPLEDVLLHYMRREGVLQ